MQDYQGNPAIIKYFIQFFGVWILEIVVFFCYLM